LQFQDQSNVCVTMAVLCRMIGSLLQRFVPARGVVVLAAGQGPMLVLVLSPEDDDSH